MLETGHAVEPVDWDQQKPHGQCHAPPSKEQWSTRSGPSGVYRHNACLLPVPSPLSLLLFLLLLFFHQPQSPPSPFLFFSPAFSAFTSSSFFTCLFSLSWPQSQTSSFLIGRYTHTHTHTQIISWRSIRQGLEVITRNFQLFPWQQGSREQSEIHPSLGPYQSLKARAEESPAGCQRGCLGNQVCVTNTNISVYTLWTFSVSHCFLVALNNLANVLQVTSQFWERAMHHLWSLTSHNSEK